MDKQEMVFQESIQKEFSYFHLKKKKTGKYDQK